MLARRLQEAMGEAHVSAEQPQAGKAPRVPSPDVHPSRPSHPARASGQGPASPVGVGLSRASDSATWRIRDRSTFTALRLDGTRVRGEGVTVTFLPNDADRPPRVGYAIGRSVGSAVARNRLRRRLRAIVTDAGPRLAPGAWLIGAGRPAAAMSFGALRTTVFDLLSQASMLRSTRS